MPEITLHVSDANEGTDSPWWVIITPRQMMKPDIESVADMITGPFFSRENAENHLEARRYAYGPRSAVYCMTGYYSNEYKQAWREAERMV